jgi:methylglyoxal synthase
MVKKRIALVAHDEKKPEIADFIEQNKLFFKDCILTGTIGTAQMIKDKTGVDVKIMPHGPDGGDIKIANEVLDGNIDLIIFFIDVKNPHGHEHDIQTLIRISVLKNVPIALNRATAEYFIKK